MKVCMVVYKYSVNLDDPCCYPLGFQYVASYFKNNGHEVKVLNYNLWDYELQDEIKDYDAVCFTGFHEFKERILQDEKICIEQNKITMVGGALATFNRIGDFKGHKFVGEIDADVPIDSIPFPDYESFGIDEYHKRHNIRYMGVLTSRGCPYSCKFCAQTCRFRMRSIDNVLTEVDMYKKRYNVETICFNDNTLNINKQRFMSICNGMKERGISWGAAIRCVPFDEDMAIAAKNSGCINLVVGVESLNQDKLDSVNKKIKVKSIIKTLDLLNKYKIPYHGNILLGFEGETAEQIVSEIQSIPAKYNLFPALVQPFIGTRCGFNRSINKEQENILIQYCSDFANMRGKFYYPTDGVE